MFWWSGSTVGVCVRKVMLPPRLLSKGCCIDNVKQSECRVCCVSSLSIRNSSLSRYVQGSQLIHGFLIEFNEHQGNIQREISGSPTVTSTYREAPCLTLAGGTKPTTRVSPGSAIHHYNYQEEEEEEEEEEGKGVCRKV